MSGQDRFQELEGKTFSRRQRTRGLSTFAAITGVSSRRPQKGISLERRKQSGGSQQIIHHDTNIREHSKLVRTDKNSWDPFRPAKDPETIEGQDATAAEQLEVIDIKPRAVALSPGVSARFNIENATYEEGDSWEVSDTNIGTIDDKEDGTAIYTQLALGDNTVIFNKGAEADGVSTTQFISIAQLAAGETGAGTSSRFIGKATAVGIPIHDHSSLGQGGPAFGVYGTD